mmetsp:Transcript_44845/g.114646  ORF Transcript_44845/g.114646 Transcript_44845/m.114646 type:complete len:332 (+) Transcript_44845:93-1088(+)|eukprot:jgi/Tetstr1/448311/TSEL_035595.t1
MAGSGEDPVGGCSRAAARVGALSRQLTAARASGPGLPVPPDQYRAALAACREELRAFISEVQCSPILLRLAWHDSGTYDKRVADWPRCGGANGSIIYDEEINHEANAGLAKAVKYLQPFHRRFPVISWADLIQLAGATAIEVVGGPAIPMRYGRVAATECAVEGNLPAAMPPFGDGAVNAATHIRNVFYRMGLTDQDIVALSGAHTIGRAFRERSGVVDNGYGQATATRFTCPAHVARGDGKPGNGMPGGMSWTKKWLSFDNSYYKLEYLQDRDNLLWLPTDHALHHDPIFTPYFERYARSQDAFFTDFKNSFLKLSELGSKWAVYPPITL